MCTRPTSLPGVLAILLTLSVAACDDGPTGPDAGDLTGNWSGSALLPNGYSAHMDLTQVGSALSGPFTISGVVRDQPLTGVFESANRRVVWTVPDGCSVWSGTLNLAADGDSMEGPIFLDASGCSDRSDASGTLSVTRG